MSAFTLHHCVLFITSKTYHYHHHHHHHPHISLFVKLVVCKCILLFSEVALLFSGGCDLHLSAGAMEGGTGALCQG